MSAGDPRAEPRTMTCGFCAGEFTEDRSQHACQACPLAQACHFARCPHCGYDNPVRPSWLDRIGTWMRDHVTT